MGKDQDILKQVEYYLSDANLKTDPFFHGLITADKEVSSRPHLAGLARH